MVSEDRKLVLVSWVTLCRLISDTYTRTMYRTALTGKALKLMPEISKGMGGGGWVQVGS